MFEVLRVVSNDFCTNLYSCICSWHNEVSVRSRPDIKWAIHISQQTVNKKQRATQAEKFFWKKENTSQVLHDTSNSLTPFGMFISIFTVLCFAVTNTYHTQALPVRQLNCEMNLRLMAWPDLILKASDISPPWPVTRCLCICSDVHKSKPFYATILSYVFIYNKTN